MLSEISDLIHHHAVFLPADPARGGRIALWRTAGGAPGAGDDAGTTAGAGTPSRTGGFEELTVVTPDLRRATVVALALPMDEALPLLTRARAAAAEEATATRTTDGTGASATAFWGAAALLALRFAARGQLLPGLSRAGHDAWRIGPLDAADLDEVRELAAAMPPTAHCVPLNADGPPAARAGAAAAGLPRRRRRHPPPLPRRPRGRRWPRVRRPPAPAPPRTARMGRRGGRRP